MRQAFIPKFAFFLTVMLALAACSSSVGAGPSPVVSPTAAPLSPQPTYPASADAFSDLPEAVRAASRWGDPRPPAYWAVWNGCAPENRADVVRANGGRAAGWFLMDDLLEDPGIQLGDYPLVTCEQGLAVLQGGVSEVEGSEGSIRALAAALLAAELNLNVGAETCPAAEEAVIGGHLVLTRVGFNGSGETAVAAAEEIASAAPRLVELLEGYNRGELCR